MDELMFRLSNQIEVLQIQASLTVQQVQQWLAVVAEQICQLFDYVKDELGSQQIQDFFGGIINVAQRGWDHLQYQLVHFKPRDLAAQLGTYFTTYEVTRRELTFCMGGLAAGILLGYCVGLNWAQSTHHMHQMKAIVCQRYIGIDGVATIDDAEMPTIRRSNDLLVQVRAASINVVDAKICHGYSKFYRRLLNSGRCKDLPVVLGRDCAGIVVDIGQSVINFDIGDEVFLAVPSWASGTLAEYLVVPENQVAKRPKLITFEASASLPYSGCIAWDAIVNKSGIKEGDAKGKRVLVYGGCTPIGCVIIQLVKLWGGYVVAACRYHAIPVTKALGADEIIPLNESNIEKEFQLHDKYDVIFNTGGLPLDEYKLRRQLLPYGSYVSTVPEHLTSDSLGFIFGSVFSSYVRLRLAIQTLFGWNIYQWKEGSKIHGEYLQALSDLVEADQLQTVVDRVFAPHNVDQALHHVMDQDALGSTIIKFQ